MNKPALSEDKSGLLNSLIWYPEYEMGYYPVSVGSEPYDADYWENYVKMAATPMGEAITLSRIKWINQWAPGASVVDIGIGCGQFITERNKNPDNKTRGYDVNPLGVEWLRNAGLFTDPYAERVQALSAWDVIEHIYDPESLLNSVEDYFFGTIPIFTSPEHILKSKHFKRDEHHWYWTAKSFETFMGWHGFRLLGTSDFEVGLGREDVMTFAFVRK